MFEFKVIYIFKLLNQKFKFLKKKGKRREPSKHQLTFISYAFIPAFLILYVLFRDFYFEST